MPTAPGVVFFDVGNTLLFPNWQRVLSPLTEQGVHPLNGLLQETERHTKKRFDAAMSRNGGAQFAFWNIFHGQLLKELGIADPTLQHTLATSMGISANWDRKRPGTREALQRIGQRRRIGIISNADGKIGNVLEACEIADCFLTVTDSGLVGSEKPDRKIFEAALTAMGAQAQDSLYVGDIYCVDYVGAKQAGMQAILFDVAGTYRDTNLPRVESLEALEEQLGD